MSRDVHRKTHPVAEGGASAEPRGPRRETRHHLPTRVAHRDRPHAGVAQEATEVGQGVADDARGVGRVILLGRIAALLGHAPLVAEAAEALHLIAPRLVSANASLTRLEHGIATRQRAKTCAVTIDAPPVRFAFAADEHRHHHQNSHLASLPHLPASVLSSSPLLRMGRHLPYGATPTAGSRARGRMLLEAM